MTEEKVGQRKGRDRKSGARPGAMGVPQKQRLPERALQEAGQEGLQSTAGSQWKRSEKRTHNQRAGGSPPLTMLLLGAGVDRMASRRPAEATILYGPSQEGCGQPLGEKMPPFGWRATLRATDQGSPWQAARQAGEGGGHPELSQGAGTEKGTRSKSV